MHLLQKQALFPPSSIAKFFPLNAAVRSLWASVFRIRNFLCEKPKSGRECARKVLTFIPGLS